MSKETIVSSRLDREITKKVIKPGDYSLVPYEDARCIIVVSNVECKNDVGDPCPMDPESRIFSESFDGNVLIGDQDSFVDRDVELILQQMCNREVCEATIKYKYIDGTLARVISCTIELQDTTEEQLVSDWGWERLYEASLHHKERGVELVKQKKMMEAFNRFKKSLKMVVAVEPIDPAVVPEETVKDMIDLKVKLYNNLAHCQLQYDEYVPALALCNKALKYEPENIKALYRRCVAHTGLKLYEEAWQDIQKVLQLDPNDKAAQQRASQLKPRIDKIKQNYANVIKKMFE